ncbi:MAG TPA: hypothetical protein VHM93_01190 [Candidatus Acidoferrum sp.]|jgi:hypothetical protein|nr:hypothetical protein [Candidatus Acidoferrum sp.]
MPSSLRSCFAIVTGVLLLALPVFPFQSPLSEEAVRDAYFLGQRNDKSTADFFSSYLKILPPPKSGPYISEVELYTPYSQLVEWSRLHSVGYSAQQAARDYHATSDSIFVRIRIDFTSTYGAFELYRSGRLTEPPKTSSAVPRPDYYRDFRAGLTQKDQWIEPLRIQLLATAWPAIGHVPFSNFLALASPSPVFLRNASFNGRGSSRGFDWCFVGWDVWLQYDASDVDSDDGTVEVFTTDGQHVVVPFDLSRLR